MACYQLVIIRLLENSSRLLTRCYGLDYHLIRLVDRLRFNFPCHLIFQGATVVHHVVNVDILRLAEQTGKGIVADPFEID